MQPWYPAKRRTLLQDVHSSPCQPCPAAACRAQPIMMHDCAITEHYMLLLDVPLEFDPQVAGQASAGQAGELAFVCNAQLPANSC